MKSKATRQLVEGTDVAAIAQISAAMRALSELTGFGVIWKNAASGGEPGMPEDQVLHLNEFCAEVKSNHLLFERCRVNDMRLVARRAEKLRRPFLSRCHAGVVELIVPIFNDDVFSGALFLGPARDRRSVCPSGASLRHFQSLPVYDAVLVRRATALLGGIARIICSYSEGVAWRGLECRGMDARIAAALRVMSSRMRKRLSAAEVAAQCGLSLSRFLHLLKKETGRGFGAHLDAMRMERASRLLTETPLSISEVSTLAGFAGQSYFAATFRRLKGFTPSEYRRRVIGTGEFHQRSRETRPG